MENVFLVVEGMDGAGKTTLINRLGIHLSNVVGADKFIKTREPGGTPYGEILRDIAKFQYETVIDCTKKMPDPVAFMTMFTSRADLWYGRLAPALESGSSVLLDRYVLSTYAYQVKTKASPLYPVYRTLLDVMFPVKPFVIFLDVSYEQSLVRRRIDTSRQEKDSIEEQFAGKTKFDALRASYMEELQNFNHIKVDTDGLNEDDVYSEVLKQLSLCPGVPKVLKKISF